MRKYADQLKLAAVKDCGADESGLKLVASRHGVDVSMLRERVAAYRSFGEVGAQAKKRDFFSYIELSVPQRMRDEGLSRRQAAARFNIRRFNVTGDWEDKYNQPGLPR